MFTYTDTSDVRLGVHLLRTATGAFAQCVPSAEIVPLSATLKMLLYALATSNSATSWIVVPS